MHYFMQYIIMNGEKSNKNIQKNKSSREFKKAYFN